MFMLRERTSSRATSDIVDTGRKQASEAEGRTILEACPPLKDAGDDALAHDAFALDVDVGCIRSRGRRPC